MRWYFEQQKNELQLFNVSEGNVKWFSWLNPNKAAETDQIPGNFLK